MNCKIKFTRHVVLCSCFFFLPSKCTVKNEKKIGPKCLFSVLYLGLRVPGRAGMNQSSAAAVLCPFCTHVRVDACFCRETV